MEFRKPFYFPAFTDFLLNYVKHRSTCLQIKNAQPRTLGTPMESLTSDQTFGGNIMQNDLVDEFNSPVSKYALTTVGVSPKNFFAVPLSSISAEDVKM